MRTAKLTNRKAVWSSDLFDITTNRQTENMQYHAPTNQFTISATELKRVSSLLLYAIRKIRDGANLDRKGYNDLESETDWAEYSEGAIIDAARDLGIDLGADRAGKLDVSNEG
jgi:hypothetical protein